MASELKTKVIEALKNVYDPEIPVNVWDLGLIYELNVNENGEVYVLMTLTAPACPIAQSIVSYVEDAIRGVEGVKDVKVELTFDPPWDPRRMTQEGRKAFKALYGYDIVEYWEKMQSQ